MRGLVATVSAIGAATVALLLAVPAQAGDDIITSVIRPNGDPTDFRSIEMDKGEVRTVGLTAENTTAMDRDATLEGDFEVDGQPKVQVKWFRKQQNITQQVKGSGYEFGIGSEATKRFRIKLTATGNNPKGCVGSHASSNGSGSFAGIGLGETKCAF